MSNKKTVAGDPEIIKTNQEGKLSNTVISMLALSQLDGFIKIFRESFLIKIKMAIHRLEK